MAGLRTATCAALAAGVLFATPVFAQKKYDAGASDTEIKVGQTIPLSGPASAYSGIAKVQAAYIRMINETGGVNGRKVNLIQYDDAYNPPKTVEQVRKLVGPHVVSRRPFTSGTSVSDTRALIGMNLRTSCGERRISPFAAWRSRQIGSSREGRR